MVRRAVDRLWLLCVFLGLPLGMLVIWIMDGERPKGLFDSWLREWEDIK